MIWADSMSVRELVLVGLWSHPKKEEVCPAVLDLSHTQDHQRGLLLAQRPPLWTLLRHPFKFKTTFHRDSLGARYLLCISTYEGFPDSLAGKESTCNAGDLGSVPELGRSPGEGNGYPLQYSSLKNPMDGGAWQATVHGVTKSRTGLRHFQFPKIKNALELKRK